MARELVVRDADPAMKQAAEFALGILVEAPAGTSFAGRLVTNPSTSPENRYVLNGKPQTLTYAPIVDIELIRELFGNFAVRGETPADEGTKVGVGASTTCPLQTSVEAAISLGMSSVPGGGVGKAKAPEPTHIDNAREQHCFARITKISSLSALSDEIRPLHSKPLSMSVMAMLRQSRSDNS